jgi:dTDP-4-amino-4,6-dideoxygalactose transaminase
MNWRVPLADLDYDERESQAVLEVLDRRWLTMGEKTAQFERQFASFVGAKHAVAVSNATVALHLACLALGIGPGDEVIVPSLTFVATANAVLYTGAEVNFADIISPDELNISPDHIESLITPQTKAIIVMHYGGYSCRMSEIIEIASKHGLAVIEDAAHAPGAFLDGKALGTLGDVGCYSFFSNKNLAMGEGGMLVTNHEPIARKARQLRSHAMTTLTWDRHLGHAFSYDVVDLGYNYRVDEIHAALGIVQLEKLPENNIRRGMITKQYWQAFRNTALGLPFSQFSEQAYLQPGYHIFPVLLPDHIDRDTFMAQLHERGVQASVHYPPVHQFTYYRSRYSGISLPITDFAASHQVTLPLFPTMTPEQVSLVITTVQSALDP